MSIEWTNNATSVIVNAGGIVAGDTSLTVTTGHGDRFPAVTSPHYYMMTIVDTAGNREIVKVTARASGSNTMTIARAQEGTSARSFAAGSIVELRVTKNALDYLSKSADIDANSYVADASAVDQGAIVNSRSIKSLVDSIGTSKSATIICAHTGSGNTTTYTVSTDLTIPENITIEVVKGAILSIDAGKTLTCNGPFDAGNYQIFSGTGAVKLSGPVKIEWFGFLTSATGAVNYAAVVAALATGSTDISATVAGDYTYDNSSITTISTAKLQLKLARGVNIKPSSSTTSVFRITGAGIKFSGGTITGTGTYVTTGSSTGRPISFIEVTDDEDADGTVTLGYRQDNEIENVLMVNPNNCGILFYRTVGGKAKGNKITSAYDDVWQQGQFGIDTSSSAQIEISNNFLDGHIQDIVGGGTTRYTFDDYSGTAAGSNVRDILITGNTMTNFRDHAVYYSSDCERITVTSNQMRSQYASSNEAIKVAYSGNVVVGNHYEGVGGGFHGRSLSKSVVSANRFVVTGESGYIFPIYIEAPTTIDLHLEGITITDNYVEATGASGCGSGIYFLAQNRDSDGSQNIIKNIIIKGNYLKNVGGNTGAGGTYRSGILMLTEKHNTPASSIFGEDIIISGNQLECSTSALYGIAMSLTTSYSAYKNVIIKDNIISGVVTNVMYLSIKNSIVKDNHFTAGIAAANGIREFVQTDTLCSNNYYGLLHSVYGTDIAAGHYLELGSSDSIFDQNYTYYNNNLGISGIVFPAGSPWTSIIVNPTAGDTPITLLSYAHINYNVGRIVTMKNLSASNKLTFELSSGGATVDIAATATKSFICIGSNTFVEL